MRTCVPPTWMVASGEGSSSRRLNERTTFQSGLARPLGVEPEAELAVFFGDHRGEALEGVTCVVDEAHHRVIPRSHKATTVRVVPKSMPSRNRHLRPPSCHMGAIQCHSLERGEDRQKAQNFPGVVGLY